MTENSEKIKLAREALESAEKLLASARVLLEPDQAVIPAKAGIQVGLDPLVKPEDDKNSTPAPTPTVTSPTPATPVEKGPRPRGIVMGVFDGLKLDAEDGKRYDLPASFVVSQGLILGDKLRLEADEEGHPPVLKIVERVKRKYLEGTLKAEGDLYSAKSVEGLYKVLPEAVAFYSFKVGGRLLLALPKFSKGKPEYTAVEPYRELPVERPREDRGRRDGRREAPRDDRRDSPRREEERVVRTERPVEAPVAVATAPVDPGRVLEEDDLR